MNKTQKINIDELKWLLSELGYVVAMLEQREDYTTFIGNVWLNDYMKRFNKCFPPSKVNKKK